jgi:ubiquinone/menaquinone biosynthesis C-methylase UbiE
MEQRTAEWLDNADFSYHEKQFETPYRSTILFCDWLEHLGLINCHSELIIADIGCGQGANIFYMSKRYPNCKFIGLELNPELVSIGNKHFLNNNFNNCKLFQADMYNLSPSMTSKIDAVLSFQTLSWLPEYTKPLNSMLSIGAQWLAFTSLFYDGPISCKIEMQDYESNYTPSTQSYYNIYSIPQIRKHCSDRNYDKFVFTPFEIDIDIPPQENKKRGTFTQKTISGNRLQFSGPILMPWYFIKVEHSK